VTEVVEIRMPAHRSQLFVLRSVMVAIALREDFALDEIGDAKLALDELCSEMVVRAAPDECISCRFETTEHTVNVVVSVGSANGRPIERDTFSWRILTAVADRVACWVTPGTTTPYVVHIVMRLPREV
jgi:serine/threonine-protein kinase RsbW